MLAALATSLPGILRPFILVLGSLLVIGCSSDRAPKINIHEGEKREEFNRDDSGVGSIEINQLFDRDLSKINESTDVSIHKENAETLIGILFSSDSLSELLLKSREKTIELLKSFNTSFLFVHEKSEFSADEWASMMEKIEVGLYSGCLEGTLNQCDFSDFYKEDYRSGYLAYYVSLRKNDVQKQMLWLKYGMHLSNRNILPLVDQKFLALSQSYLAHLFESGETTQWNRANLDEARREQLEQYNGLLALVLERAHVSDEQVLEFLRPYVKMIFNSSLSRVFDATIEARFANSFSDNMDVPEIRELVLAEVRRSNEQSDYTLQKMRNQISKINIRALESLMGVESENLSLTEDEEILIYIFKLVFRDFKEDIASSLYKGLPIIETSRILELLDIFLKTSFLYDGFMVNQKFKPLFDRALSTRTVDDARKIYEFGLGEPVEIWRAFQSGATKLVRFVESNIVDLSSNLGSDENTEIISEIKKFVFFLPENIKMVSSLPNQLALIFLMTKINKPLEIESVSNISIKPEDAMGRFFGGSILIPYKPLFPFSSKGMDKDIDPYNAFLAAYYFIDLGLLELYGLGEGDFFSTLLSTQLRFQREVEIDDEDMFEFFDAEVLLNQYNSYYEAMQGTRYSTLINICRATESFAKDGISTPDYINKIYISDLVGNTYHGMMEINKNVYFEFFEKLYDWSDDHENKNLVVDEAYEFLRSDVDPRLRRIVALRDTMYRKWESEGKSGGSVKDDIETAFGRYLNGRSRLLQNLNSLMSESTPCLLSLTEEEIRRRNILFTAEKDHYGHVHGLLKDLDSYVGGISRLVSDFSLLGTLDQTQRNDLNQRYGFQTDQNVGLGSIEEALNKWYLDRYFKTNIAGKSDFTSEFKRNGGFKVLGDGEVELRFSLYEFLFRIANYLEDGYYDETNTFNKILKPEAKLIVEYPETLDRFLDADNHAMKTIHSGSKIKVVFRSDNERMSLETGMQETFSKTRWHNYGSWVNNARQVIQNYSGYYKYAFNSNLNYSDFLVCDESCKEQKTARYRDESQKFVSIVNRIFDTMYIDEVMGETLDILLKSTYFASNGPHKLFYNSISLNDQDNYLGLYDSLYKEATRHLGGYESRHRFHLSKYDSDENQLKRVSPFDAAVDYYDFQKKLDNELVVGIEESSRIQLMGAYQGLVLAERMMFNSLDQVIDEDSYADSVGSWQFDNAVSVWREPKKLSFGTRSSLRTQIQEFDERTANMFKPGE